MAKKAELLEEATNNMSVSAGGPCGRDSAGHVMSTVPVAKETLPPATANRNRLAKIFFGMILPGPGLWPLV